MNFTSRTILGNLLTQKLPHFRGKGAIILCLQESSLLMCLSMARELHAWVFPLIYEPVYMGGHGHRLLGAYDQDGDFCPDPDGLAAKEPLSPQMTKTIESQKPEAMKAIKAQLTSFDMKLNKHHMDGRDVIMAGDILTNAMPLVVAQRVLSQVSPKSLTTVVGNVTPEVAELVRISAADTVILDVLTGTVFDHNHYFEHGDSYTTEQTHSLTQHIAAFWQ